ncbi:MAG TPA: uroporphyrinogen-III synthase [Ramlibacter sp.]|nr:uroporphyrinogen-III synthase [Ramlibacter sp.]
MRVVLTRPEEDAPAWAEALRTAGHQVLELPLIRIAAVADEQPLREAARRAGGFHALMFVSANAVRHVAAHLACWPTGVRAWCTGPGTAQALRQAGVPRELVDAPAERFDSEGLWELVAPQATAGRRVLIVRGADAVGQPAGRDWLAGRLLAHGALVEEVAAYRRAAPAWTDTQQEAARAAAADGSVWLFSSSEAVRNLLRLLPAQAWSAARAVATHERIAQAARGAGFGVVCLSRASREAVSATLESFR